ncbi:MAG TPA: GNAT family N-acetyltransferase [Caldilinea sp.]|nr:GNAT family N-acetyltransferase [Caldilinea sp.]
MTLQVAPFEVNHLEDAAVLVCARYAALRLQAPLLPTHFADRNVVRDKLAELLQTSPGVVAIRQGKVVGLLAAHLLPSFRGRRGVYSPEWANGAELDDASEIYQELYRVIAADWVRNGYLSHALTIFANDHRGREAWHWQGFGMIVADALRDLSSVKNAPRGCEIRRAVPADIDDVKRLQLGLRRHLASAPIFLPMQAKWEHERYRAWLADPDVAIWLAYRDGNAIASMRAEMENDGAGELVRDGGTVAITGAYTEPAERSGGLATALLQHVVDWATEQGAVRISVDFETQNIDGARFWLRHFQPVAYSMMRQVDDRILWANAEREETAYW